MPFKLIPFQAPGSSTKVWGLCLHWLLPGVTLDRHSTELPDVPAACEDAGGANSLLAGAGP